jgi:hypothetical protein
MQSDTAFVNMTNANDTLNLLYVNSHFVPVYLLVSVFPQLVLFIY